MIGTATDFRLVVALGTIVNASPAHESEENQSNMKMTLLPEAVNEFAALT